MLCFLNDQATAEEAYRGTQVRKFVISIDRMSSIAFAVDYGEIRSIIISVDSL